jgi:alkyl hydroperoxide reductase subunit AhpC
LLWRYYWSYRTDFEAETTHGKIRFHEWLGDSWGTLLASERLHACMHDGAWLHGEAQVAFRSAKRKVIGLSVDPVERHHAWSKDIEETQGQAPNYPMIGDPTLASRSCTMLPADAGDTCEGRTPADNQTVRTVYVIGPDKKIKLMISYPMTTGRNFDEILRGVDSMQLTAKHKVATPANWRDGEDVIIAGSVSDDEARKVYPDGWNAPRPYLRIVPQPR